MPGKEAQRHTIQKSGSKNGEGGRDSIGSETDEKAAKIGKEKSRSVLPSLHQWGSMGSG